jgi:hypothetical protein
MSAWQLGNEMVWKYDKTAYMSMNAFSRFFDIGYPTVAFYMRMGMPHKAVCVRGQMVAIFEGVEWIKFHAKKEEIQKKVKAKEKELNELASSWLDMLLLSESVPSPQTLTAC